MTVILSEGFETGPDGTTIDLGEVEFNAAAAGVFTSAKVHSGELAFTSDGADISICVDTFTLVGEALTLTAWVYAHGADPDDHDNVVAAGGWYLWLEDAADDGSAVGVVTVQFPRTVLPNFATDSVESAGNDALVWTFLTTTDTGGHVGYEFLSVSSSQSDPTAEYDVVWTASGWQQMKLDLAAGDWTASYGEVDNIDEGDLGFIPNRLSIAGVVRSAHPAYIDDVLLIGGAAVTIFAATRQFPRDDVLGLGSATRIFPPPKAARVAGGYS